MVRAATGGVLIFMDTLMQSSQLPDAWAQWFAWQAHRWLKSTSIIRPHRALRLLLHEPLSMRKVRCSPEDGSEAAGREL